MTSQEAAIMKKMFGFVVLNYNNYQEAIACVESILAISGENYRVAVVDNDSPNDSFDVLRTRFAGQDKIDVLQSGRNGGYSAGNNVGIDCLGAMGIRDIIIATSDTVVLSKDILEQFERLAADDLGVVGPGVVNLNNDAQNPMLANMSLRYAINIHFPALAAVLRSAVNGWRRRGGARAVAASAVAAPVDADVYMVHGCFLYLTSHYLERCGKLDESLFMYGEEDLLAYNCRQAKLRTLYAPGVAVLHKEAQSTPGGANAAFFNVNSKESIRYLQSRLGLATLLKYAARARSLL